jgi:F0F1-type ATP synthase membrane subunit b/b'
MDDTLKAVGQLLIQSLPTFFIVLFLYFYLKQVFFGPLERVLSQRREATEGARAQAAVALERAAAKTAQYEEQLRAARNEIYKEQEEQRKLWRDQQSAQIAEARRSAEAAVAAGKAEIAAEADAAKRSLASGTQALADRITAAILQGRAA